MTRWFGMDIQDTETRYCWNCDREQIFYELEYRWRCSECSEMPKNE